MMIQIREACRHLFGEFTFVHRVTSPTHVSRNTVDLMIKRAPTASAVGIVLQSQGDFVSEYCFNHPVLSLPRTDLCTQVHTDKTVKGH